MNDAVPAPDGDAMESGEPSLLDWEKLAELEVALSRPQLENFVSLYLMDLERHLGGIAECQAARDLAGISRHAHILISTAGNLGATQTSEAARHLDIACRSEDLEQVAGLIAELTGSCGRSAAAFQAWLNEDAADLPSTVAR